MALAFSPLLAQKKRDKRKEKSLRSEISDQFLKKWLKQDVRYIITPSERSAFKQLTDDEQRYQFVEQFWLRRDPTPDTFVNETRDEHYRRIAYANERFTSGKPGWKTDRGIIYIMYGPPHTIETEHGGAMDTSQSRPGRSIHYWRQFSHLSTYLLALSSHSWGRPGKRGGC